MKSKVIITALILIVIALIAVIVMLVSNTDTRGLSTQAPPDTANLIVQRSVVGGMQEQPAFMLYDNKRLYVTYEGKFHSMEVPHSSYMNIQPKVEEWINEPADVSLENGIRPGNCMAMVDGLDTTWTFVKQDGSRVVVDCKWDVDSQNPVIADFDFLARMLWLQVGE